MYYCKDCGRPAVVTEHGIVRSCQCQNSVIVVSMSSNLKGEGGVKS